MKIDIEHERRRITKKIEIKASLPFEDLGMTEIMKYESIQWRRKKVGRKKKDESDVHENGNKLSQVIKKLWSKQVVMKQFVNLTFPYKNQNYTDAEKYEEKLNFGFIQVQIKTDTATFDVEQEVLKDININNSCDLKIEACLCDSNTSFECLTETDFVKDRQTSEEIDDEEILDSKGVYQFEKNVYHEENEEQILRLATDMKFEIFEQDDSILTISTIHSGELENVTFYSKPRNKSLDISSNLKSFQSTNEGIKKVKMKWKFGAFLNTVWIFDPGIQKKLL